MKQPSGNRLSRLELFEQVMVPHLNSAYNLARWLTRNDYDAQDIAQESYLRAFRFFDGYNGGDPKAWLLAIVRNTCQTWLRRENRGRSMVVFDEEVHGRSLGAASIQENLEEEGRRRVLHGCIEALPPEYREVLVMRELEEMSYWEIANTAQVPLGTVMSRLSRARRLLAECAGRLREGARA